MKTYSNSKPWKFQALYITISMLLVPASYCAPAGKGGTNDAPKLPASEKRDPFWPVGFVPERIRNAAMTDAQKSQKHLVGNQGWSAAMKQVVINGISSRSDNEFFAVINGEVKSVGDSVESKYGGSVYVWAVESITPPGSVKLRRVSVR